MNTGPFALLFKSCILAVLATLLGLNLTATILGFENWPFTPAPMFAHYIDAETPRYAFEYRAHFENGTEAALNYPSVGAHWALNRFFFKYVYGSAEAESVFAEFPQDSVQAFEARLSAFFSAFVKMYAQRQNIQPEELKQIDLLVHPLHDSMKQAHFVGTFLVKEQIFSHKRNRP